MNQMSRAATEATRLIVIRLVHLRYDARNASSGLTFVARRAGT
jgi:hypothetical protein